MNQIPHDLYRTDQVRALDLLAAEEFGIPGTTLMVRAGHAAFALLRRRWPTARRIAVCCGGGNNGGDGYVVARLARQVGMEVLLFRVEELERLQGEARAAAQAAISSGLQSEPLDPVRLRSADVVVDALLGTGLNGEVRDAWGRAIAAINGSGRPVLALDVPSGLDADNGAVLGTAVQADVTVTFVGVKQGLFTGSGPALSGEIYFDDLQIPEEAYARVPVAARRLTWADFSPRFVARARDAHKGDFGHVLVIGGEHGYASAARLAAEAAARVGAGLVSVATRAGHAAAMVAVRPELMCHGVENVTELEPLLRRASVVVVGPGLGQGTWGQAMLGRVVETGLPLVVDADALNLLAEEPVRRDDWILTPHPGEAARLLGEDAAQVQQGRFAAAAGLQVSYGGVVVLKGPGTLVLGPDGMPGVCGGGNPGMASGGMGDVLTGVIAGLLAQGFELRQAAAAGACLHAAAADAAAADGERGMLAGDLMPHLRRLANP